MIASTQRDSEAREVLIVDDSVVSGQYVSIIVNDIDGYRVVGHATNEQQLEALLEQYKPEIIFMDVILPDMNGIEATKRIAKTNPEINIIVLTSLGEDPETVDQALSAGATAVMAKPATKEQILKIFGSTF